MNALWSFSGDPTTPITNTAYPSGSTFAECHAGTGWLLVDSGLIATGTYVLSGMVKVSGGGVTATCILVNLTDAPDTPIASFSESSATGMCASSLPVAFAAAGTLKTYAVKVKVNASSGQVWGIQLVKIA